MTAIQSEALHTDLDMIAMGKQAQIAGRALALKSTLDKNALLMAIADALDTSTDSILTENARDLDDARAANMEAWMIDRLSLQTRLRGVASDVRAVAGLPDPVGEVFDAATMPSGIALHKIRVPLGVIGVIYEARPNVTVDIATLALKTGNAVILRGGKETLRSNRILVNLIRDVLTQHDFPADAVQLIDTPDRKYVAELLKMHQCVDMIIPRGGASLHEFCRQNSTIPVIIGGIGICHLYVDESANIDRSLDVIMNAKIQRPSVCNSLDTVLVNRQIATAFLPELASRMIPAGVTLHVDPAAGEYVRVDEQYILNAAPDAFDQEWLSLDLGVRVVEDLDQAIAHIQEHSTQHSDGILSETPDHAARFLNEIDSAAVFHNASTRFNDGGQFGLGAEVAVSTQKLHARGPMGLKELTTFKWVVVGDYTVRG